MSVLRIPSALWAKVHQHLYSTPGEHFAFLRARWGDGATGPVFVAHDVFLVPDVHVSCGQFDYEVRLEGILPAINALAGTSDALIELHNHGGDHPRFSRTDRAQLPDFVQYMLESLPGRPYGATVWGDDTVYGEWFRSDAQSGVIRSITVSGGRLRSVVSRDDDWRSPAPCFDRQIAWLTREGQRHLAKLKVAVVGAGGTGSLVIQLLAYLGVRDFVIIEPDVVEESNLNRLVTAATGDVGVAKGVVAERMLKRISPDVVVHLVEEGIPSPCSLRVLTECDVIFGCVDDDGPRHVLNAVARAFCIPYFDLGVGINPEEHGLEAGGRLIAVLPGGPCLHCAGELDLNEVRHWMRTRGERAFAERRGYVSGMDIPAPSVVSLNAIVAAAAVNEFSILVSGLRSVNTCTDFDLVGSVRSHAGQWVTPRLLERLALCLECANEGRAGALDLESYWRRMQDS